MELPLGRLLPPPGGELRRLQRRRQPAGGRLHRHGDAVGGGVAHAARDAAPARRGRHGHQVSVSGGGAGGGEG